ncbi:MAG: RNA polymerase sigma factor [Polyangiaceae bacterium]
MRDSDPLLTSGKAEPHAQLDDVEILSALRSCDTSVASQLYVRVRPQVDRTIVRLLGRRDSEHDDLVQLSMIALIGSLASFRGECSLDTWTSRVTARTVFNELRKRRSRNRLFDPCCDGDVDTEGPASQSRQLSMRSALQQIRKHLDAIEPAKAWTVLLHDAWGYDLREIAEITGASIAAAQSRLVRGRAELQSRLERDNELAGILESTEEGA